MSQHPLNELKRRLQDDATPLPKRFRLAKNVVQSHHFPTAPKERVVAEWLDELIKDNKFTSKELGDVLGWLNNVDDFTSELKCKLIKVVCRYLHSNILQNSDSVNIIAFLESNKISHQLTLQIDDFLFITTTLLQNLHNESNYTLVENILNNISRYYKESKKKLEFIVKFLEGDHLETVFSFLYSECHSVVVNFCQNVLFPLNKKQFFSSFLINLIRKDNIDELIAEKGDNIQSVLKIMSSFFTFPKGRTDKDPKFLSDFIYTFVRCFQSESQICFAFYIMTCNAFNMAQNYIMPAMNMPPITFENDDKIKRNLFLKMLEVLHSQEVDINVRLTDTLAEKIAKVEIKKNFIAFIQAVMMGQLKLQGKLDKVTLQIIKVALKLDPSIVEQKLDKILPHIMTVKKNKSEVLNTYKDTMKYLLETLFKLSRGVEFINHIIPHVKLCLEASNVEQFELKQKLTQAMNDGDNIDKIKSAILTGEDILPAECVELYGRLSSELMFRQSRVLLLSLQKDFEENCLMMLEEGFVSPSIITLSDVLSAILSSFFRYNKMADHTVPIPIAEDFWSVFQDFENQCLNKFGECVLKLNYNPPLVLAFLQLCLSFSQLKLLNIKYSNTKLKIIEKKLISFPSKDKLTDFTNKIQEEEAVIIWGKLLEIISMAMEITDNVDEVPQIIPETKTNALKLLTNDELLKNKYYFTNVLFRNLDKNQLKILTKTIFKRFAVNGDIGIFQTDAVNSNKKLLQNIVLKLSKNILDCIENASSLSKALKRSFEISSLIENNVPDYFNNTSIQNEEGIIHNLEIFKHLCIYYLDEKFQLAAILVLLIVKNCNKNKKIKHSIDYILQMIFELSPKYPDLFKILPVDFVFDFNNNMLELLKLNSKCSTLIIKSTLEFAVKKVKTDPNIVKSIVEILLKNHIGCKITSIENFDNRVFQISCLILPIIAKEKKAITTSAYRSILANLQDKLNNAMLDSFKNIDFDTNNFESVGAATLNAMGAYSVTLLKCCETNDAQEIKNLDYLFSGLEFFVNSAIQSIQNSSTKRQHLETSIHLLNVTLRYIKKLEAHSLFKDKDKLFKQIWESLKLRLLMAFDQRQKEKISNNCLDEISVTLKFLAELSSVDCFCNHFVGDLSNLALLKKPSLILKNEDLTFSQLISRRVSKYLWYTCLKANIIEPKCIAMTKLIFRATKNVKFWIQQHYDVQKEIKYNNEQEIKLNEIKVDDAICEILRIDLDVLSEVILAAKKITLDYKFLDATLELFHLIQYILGCETTQAKCVISWEAFVSMFEGCVVLLNNLLVSREEMLEDRWPCYMQCYKTLILCLCERANLEADTDLSKQQKLAELAHTIEKLTQSICKRKFHVSRISAYALADICTWIESKTPPKMLRQHLENSITLLIEAADSTYARAFLMRAFAGSIGQMTLTNMYTVYKRYRKYIGNS